MLNGLINGVIMENFQNKNTKNMKIIICGLIVYFIDTEVCQWSLWGYFLVLNTSKLNYSVSQKNGDYVRF